ncbi:ADP-ribosylglycohydrolase family protein [Actinomycetaceae bacterium MB13-C1-2]|nr:ADP-ribosylglycohydrolase family protein [Actinomycetaceae bacterium MB13-C1-2]
MRLTWAQPEDLLPHEFVQSSAEGLDIAPWLQRWVEAGGDPIPAVSGASQVPASPELRELARKLLAEIDESIAANSDDEPNDWESIRALIDTDSALFCRADSQYRRRVYGAWLGRSVGCLLGKPVEKIPREGIEEILRATGRWPLQSWFTEVGLPAEVARRWPWNRRSAPVALEENISGMPEDDDLNYPILALELVEDRGPDFTTDDVATLWLNSLPAGRAFTAERAAYRNILDARPVPETATHLNPFREWIGALIRADLFGWINPGSLDTAVNMAWRDARLSHTRNGIYGAMWSAALCWASLGASTVEEVLDEAIKVVPPKSRLHAAITFGRDLGRQCELSGDDAETDVRIALDSLHEEYGHLHWVHVLNNAATIAFALSAGKGNFVTSISLAVTAGWDTDSVGATVGAVVGALAEGDIDSYWTEPIEGRIATSVPAKNLTDGSLAIAGLVERTCALGDRRS